jgi:hypothetical protein
METNSTIAPKPPKFLKVFLSAPSHILDDRGLQWVILEVVAKPAFGIVTH